MAFYVPRSKLAHSVFSWQNYQVTLSFRVMRSINEEMFLLEGTGVECIKPRLFILFWPRCGIRRDDVVTTDAARIQWLHHHLHEKRVRMVILEDVSWHQWVLLPKHIHPETFQSSLTKQSVAYFWRQLNPISCLDTDPKSIAK